MRVDHHDHEIALELRCNFFYFFFFNFDGATYGDNIERKPELHETPFKKIAMRGGKCGQFRTPASVARLGKC